MEERLVFVSKVQELVVHFGNTLAENSALVTENLVQYMLERNSGLAKANQKFALTVRRTGGKSEAELADMEELKIIKDDILLSEKFFLSAVTLEFYLNIMAKRFSKKFIMKCQEEFTDLYLRTTNVLSSDYKHSFDGILAEAPSLKMSFLHFVRRFNPQDPNDLPFENSICVRSLFSNEYFVTNDDLLESLLDDHIADFPDFEIKEILRYPEGGRSGSSEICILHCKHSALKHLFAFQLLQMLCPRNCTSIDMQVIFKNVTKIESGILGNLKTRVFKQCNAIMTVQFPVFASCDGFERFNPSILDTIDEDSTILLLLVLALIGISNLKAKHFVVAKRHTKTFLVPLKLSFLRIQYAIVMPFTNILLEGMSVMI